jgi:hypothetical protein
VSPSKQFPPPSLALLIVPLCLALACGGARPGPAAPAADTETESTAAFLAVDRHGGGAGNSERGREMAAVAPGSFNPGHSFYLAINKRGLDQRWFASAYLEQYSDSFPSWAGSAHSLGTRVVSFRIQNGKLFMFDADDRHRFSDSFGSDDIVDAYPIVNPSDIADADDLPDAIRRKLNDYVVIDPAAGLNHYNMVSDAYAAGEIGFDNFKVELAFSQNFRALQDGVAFEQAFTGYSEGPHEKLDAVDTNYFRSSGVLGLSLRRYQESPGFVPSPPPPKDFFFHAPPKRVIDTGETAEGVAKWNIHPGMEPIRWLISPGALKRQQSAELQALGIDLVGALKAGIESWNQAFGFTALQVELTDDDHAFADDSKNVVLYDSNPTIGFAFADMRYNPNTGEIRGASVYFPDTFLTYALIEFAPQAGVAEPTTVSAPAGRHTLSWQPFPHQHLCDLRPAQAGLMKRALGIASATPEMSGSPKEQIEKLIASVVAHEIGHTLSLRHNFKGSLVPPTNSVMDYVDNTIRIAAALPGVYDIDVIRYLYNLSPTPPAQPFCTDQHVGSDPACNQFDAGADPLRDYFGPLFTAFNKFYLTTGDKQIADIAVKYLLPGIVLYMQSGDTAVDRTAAWDFATADLKAPVAPARLAQFPYTYAAGTNYMITKLFGLMVPDPATLFLFPGGPPLDPPQFDATITGLLLGELRGNLLNLDGIRSYPTRRLVVDSLKWLQSPAAYEVLRASHATLSAPLEPALTGDEANLTADLLARIQQAMTPYFK